MLENRVLNDSFTHVQKGKGVHFWMSEAEDVLRHPCLASFSFLLPVTWNPTEHMSNATERVLMTVRNQFTRHACSIAEKKREFYRWKSWTKNFEQSSFEIKAILDEIHLNKEFDTDDLWSFRSGEFTSSYTRLGIHKVHKRMLFLFTNCLWKTWITMCLCKLSASYQLCLDVSAWAMLRKMWRKG